MISPRPPAGGKATGAAAAAAAKPLQAFAMQAPAGRLSETQQEIVELCAAAVQQLGLSRSIGQIFGVIYCSPRPLAFADVVGILGISNGSASQGLRILRELGAIHLVEVVDDRREHFVAEVELRRLLAGMLATRVRKPLEAGTARLKTLQRRLDESSEPDAEFLRQRLDSLQTWHRKALLFLPLIQGVLGSGKG